MLRRPVRYILHTVAIFLAGAAAEMPPAFPAGTGDLQEAADRARTKVVVLKTRRRGGVGSATGFLARPGLVLSTAHSVASVTGVTAWVNGVQYPAQVTARHPETDVALLTLRAPRLLLKPVELAPEPLDLSPGEPLVILAGPSQGPRATGDPAHRVPIPGRFASRLRLADADGRPGLMLGIEAGVELGDSGSPVLRVRDGRVVGILSSREIPGPDGISRRAYAVPMDLILPWLRSVAPPEPPARDPEFYLFELAK